MAILSDNARTVLSISSTAYVLSVFFVSSTIRSTLRHLLAPSAHPLRFLALVLALILNGKSLPLAWHVRILFPMAYQLYLQPKPLPEDALFRPIIMKGTRSPLLDVDYNVHKSNSTYFADLDVGRAALVTCLLRQGIRKAAKQPAAEIDAILTGMTRAKGVVDATTAVRTPHASSSSPPPTSKRGPQKNERFIVALGGVSCNFKRELKPSEQFDVWTRVLSWDRKWIYLLSHMVRPGTIVPDDFALQPWKTNRSMSSGLFERFMGGKRKTKRSTTGALKALESEQSEAWKKGIFATSISKYVVKKGRLTIHPEVVWERSGLLPPRPETTQDSVEGETEVETSETSEAPDAYAWNWENVEKERQRGWELAQHFAALDGAVEESFASWPSRDGELKTLGEYVDLMNF